MKISILGCGWLGLPLAYRLAERGHTVQGSSTNSRKLEEMPAHSVTPFLIDVRSTDLCQPPVKSFFQCDVLVITLPPSLGDDLSTIFSTLIGVARINRIPKIIYTSSTSVYGNPNGTVDESAPVAPSRRGARLTLAAEEILRSTPGIDCTCIRFGGLVGPGRHPGNFLKGEEPIPNGLGPVNLIHLDDCIGIVAEIIEGSHEVSIINAVSPHHPTRSAFYTAAAKALGKPLPRFVGELADWKIVESAALQGSIDYQFRIADWFEWLGKSKDGVKNKDDVAEGPAS